MSDSGSLKEEVQPQNGEISSVPVINHLDDVPFNKSPVSAPVETSTATAVAVKPYNPNPSRSITEMTSVLDSDRQALIDSSDEDSLSSDDSDYDQSTLRIGRRGSVRLPAKWWFQEPAVKKNLCIVIGAWILVFLGIASFITGVVLEITYHDQSQDILRGIIFFVVAIVVLVPSVYAVVHIYLAAKRVGKVRFSSVWFFR